MPPSASVPGLLVTSVWHIDGNRPLGTINLAAARTVGQLREVLLSTLGAERLPTPGFEFLQAGCALLQSQEEEWPATALRGGLVLSPSADPRHATVPPTRRLEVCIEDTP